MSTISPTIDSSRASRAFTLIELLTVIAIIGILAAIIIPTVGKVRESAKAATCASNLRQVGAAMAMWSNDNKDRYMPSMVTGMAGFTGYYWQWFGSQHSSGLQQYGLSPLAGYMGFGMDVADDGWRGLNKLTICPLNQRTTRQGGDASGAYGFPYVANYYVMAHPGGPGGGLKTPLPISSVSSPSTIVMLIDAPATDVSPATVWGLGIADPPNLGRIAEPHGGKANVMWADYHVTRAKKADFAVTRHLNPNP